MLQHQEECEEAKKAMREVVHGLVGGYTPCTLEGIPKDWPEGHRWSGDPADITCPECFVIFEGLEKDREILSKLPMPDLDKFNVERTISKEDIRRALSEAPSPHFGEPPQIPDYPPADAHLLGHTKVAGMVDDASFMPRPGIKTKYAKKLAPAPVYEFPLEPCDKCGCNMVMGEWRWDKINNVVIVGMECGGSERHRRVVELEEARPTVLAKDVRPGDVISGVGDRSGPQTVMGFYHPDGDWFQIEPGGVDNRVFCAGPFVDFLLLRRVPDGEEHWGHVEECEFTTEEGWVCNPDCNAGRVV
jgi:hypothetical protein